MCLYVFGFVIGIRAALFEGLAFDNVRRFLYCTDSKRGRILQICLNGSSSDILKNTKLKPRNIAVDEKNR